MYIDSGLRRVEGLRYYGAPARYDSTTRHCFGCKSQRREIKAEAKIKFVLAPLSAEAAEQGNDSTRPYGIMGSVRNLFLVDVGKRRYLASMMNQYLYLSRPLRWLYGSWNTNHVIKALRRHHNAGARGMPLLTIQPLAVFRKLTVAAFTAPEINPPTVISKWTPRWTWGYVRPCVQLGTMS